MNSLATILHRFFFGSESEPQETEYFELKFSIGELPLHYSLILNLLVQSLFSFLESKLKLPMSKKLAFIKKAIRKLAISRFGRKKRG